MILIVMSLLLVKHFLVDFPFQTQQEIALKGTYGNLKGAMHSVKHGMMTLVVFTIANSYVSPSVPIAALLFYGVLDFFTHYHIDWAKMQLSKKLTPADKKFWVYLGLDQLLHGLFYIALVAIYF